MSAFTYELRTKLVRRQSELLAEIGDRDAELEAVGAALRALEPPSSVTKYRPTSADEPYSPWGKRF